MSKVTEPGTPRPLNAHVVFLHAPVAAQNVFPTKSLTASLLISDRRSPRAPSVPRKKGLSARPQAGAFAAALVSLLRVDRLAPVAATTWDHDAPALSNSRMAVFLAVSSGRPL
jgi:hypothetical protein